MGPVCLSRHRHPAGAMLVASTVSPLASLPLSLARGCRARRELRCSGRDAPVSGRDSSCSSDAANEVETWRADDARAAIVRPRVRLILWRRELTVTRSSGILPSTAGQDRAGLRARA
jgi:hypothetical protein